MGGEPIVMDRSKLSKASQNAVGRQDRSQLLPYHAVRSLADEVVLRLASRFQERNGAESPRVELDVQRFTSTLLEGTLEECVEIVTRELDKGVPVDAIYMHTLAGSARMMGQMWVDDTLSFVDMTVATGRIYSVMHALRMRAQENRRDALPDQHALLVSCPGEDHTLGVTMAADMLRGKNWQITLRTGKSYDELMELIEDEHHAIIGISASNSESMSQLTRLIVALRITQPWAKIFVAGEIVASVPTLKQVLAVDAVLRPDQDAMVMLEEMRLAVRRENEARLKADLVLTELEKLDLDGFEKDVLENGRA